MPAADWVLLGSGKSNRGFSWQLYMQLVCKRTLPSCKNIVKVIMLILHVPMHATRSLTVGRHGCWTI